MTSRVPDVTMPVQCTQNGCLPHLTHQLEELYPFHQTQETILVPIRVQEIYFHKL